jgi:hypothetical protein
MFTVAQCLFDLIVCVVLSLGEYIGLETAAHKVSCSMVGGWVADLDTEAWDQRREIRWCNERAGHLGVLGKLLNLQSQQVIDDPARLVKLVEKIQEILIEEYDGLSLYDPVFGLAGGGGRRARGSAADA